MRRMILLVAVLLSATVLLAAALEPLNVKPGLWQVTMTNTIKAVFQPRQPLTHLQLV